MSSEQSSSSSNSEFKNKKRKAIEPLENITLETLFPPLPQNAVDQKNIVGANIHNQPPASDKHYIEELLKKLTTLKTKRFKLLIENAINEINTVKQKSDNSSIFRPVAILKIVERLELETNQKWFGFESKKKIADGISEIRKTIYGRKQDKHLFNRSDELLKLIRKLELVHKKSLTIGQRLTPRWPRFLGGIHRKERGLISNLLKACNSGDLNEIAKNLESIQEQAKTIKLSNKFNGIIKNINEIYRKSSAWKAWNEIKEWVVVIENEFTDGSEAAKKIEKHIESLGGEEHELLVNMLLSILRKEPESFLLNPKINFVVSCLQKINQSHLIRDLCEKFLGLLRDVQLNEVRIIGIDHLEYAFKELRFLDTVSENVYLKPGFMEPIATFPLYEILSKRLFAILDKNEPLNLDELQRCDVIADQLKKIAPDLVLSLYEKLGKKFLDSLDQPFDADVLRSVLVTIEHLEKMDKNFVFAIYDKLNKIVLYKIAEQDLDLLQLRGVFEEETIKKILSKQALDQNIEAIKGIVEKVFKKELLVVESYVENIEPKFLFGFKGSEGEHQEGEHQNDAEELQRINNFLKLKTKGMFKIYEGNDEGLSIGFDTDEGNIIDQSLRNRFLTMISNFSRDLSELIKFVNAFSKNNTLIYRAIFSDENFMDQVVGEIIKREWFSGLIDKAFAKEESEDSNQAIHNVLGNSIIKFGEVSYNLQEVFESMLVNKITELQNARALELEVIEKIIGSDWFRKFSEDTQGQLSDLKQKCENSQHWTSKFFAQRSQIHVSVAVSSSSSQDNLSMEPAEIKKKLQFFIDEIKKISVIEEITEDHNSFFELYGDGWYEKILSLTQAVNQLQNSCSNPDYKMNFLLSQLIDCYLNCCYGKELSPFIRDEQGRVNDAKLADPGNSSFPINEEEIITKVVQSAIVEDLVPLVLACSKKIGDSNVTGLFEEKLPVEFFALQNVYTLRREHPDVENILFSFYEEVYDLVIKCLKSRPINAKTGQCISHQELCQILDSEKNDKKPKPLADLLKCVDFLKNPALELLKLNKGSVENDIIKVLQKIKVFLNSDAQPGLKEAARNIFKFLNESFVASPSPLNQQVVLTKPNVDISDQLSSNIEKDDGAEESLLGVDGGRSTRKNKNISLVQSTLLSSQGTFQQPASGLTGSSSSSSDASAPRNSQSPS